MTADLPRGMDPSRWVEREEHGIDQEQCRRLRADRDVEHAARRTAETQVCEARSWACWLLQEFTDHREPPSPSDLPSWMRPVPGQREEQP
jgi:hypothetical protein